MKNQENTKKEEQYESKKGLIALIICGIISIGLAIACVFFRDEFFGLFIK